MPSRRSGWIISREHRAVAAALLTGVALVLASSLAVPLSHNIHFYASVLPSLSSGGYNELIVPVSIFGNHSFAQIYERLFAAEGSILPTSAMWLHRFTVIAIVVWALLNTRNKTMGPWARPARFAILCGVSMMLPIYVFEHHLVPSYLIVQKNSPPLMLDSKRHFLCHH